MDFSRHGTERIQDKLVSKGSRNKRKVFISVFKIILVSFVLVIIACAGAGFGMIKGILDDSPDVSTINIQPKGFKSYIINEKTGKEQRELSTTNSNRVYVYYEDIPADVVNAFVAIEDQRFWEHNGIDIRGIFRAGFSGIASGRFDQGASTLTQQLIKNHVFNVGLGEKTFMERLNRKIQEQYLAIQLEQIYSKEEIAEYYLNTIYLGQGVNGVEAAAERYFNKTIQELTISEIATIAGITKNPYKYDPVNFPEENVYRREDVLDKMLELGYITQSQYNIALADQVYDRIEAVKVERDENKTAYTYYEDAIFAALQEDLMALYGITKSEAAMEIYTGGYEIYSVQDLDLQKICDATVNDPKYYPDNTKVGLDYRLTVVDSSGKEINYGINSLLKYYRKETGNPKYNNIYPKEELARAAAEQFKEYVLDETGAKFVAETFTVSLEPQATFTLIDQKTGYIKAIVGGRGEKTVNRGLNRATSSPRQPGSTFKVLAAFLPYIDTGGSLCSPFEDAPYNFANGGIVKNWYKSYRGYSTIRQAIANSMNIIAVKAITAVTPEVSYEYLINLGFTTIIDEKIEDGFVYTDKTQSAALGGLTKGVTNLEITAAYAAIANGGIYTKPVFYSKVIDHDGNVIIDNTDPSLRQHQAMKPTTAWMLIEGMKDVVTSGTGTAARMTYGIECAGKTGTTSNNYDLWFCGMNPYYTGSVWYGYDSNVDIGSTTNHKKMWRDIMDQIATYEEFDKSAKIMGRPEGISSITLCQITGMRPAEGCPTFTDYCASGTGPGERCKGHESITICMDSHEIATNACTNTQTFVVSYDENDKKYLIDADFVYTDAIFTSQCHLHPPIVESYTIEASAGSGGTISDSVTVPAGSTVTFTITPFNGYVIANVIVDGVSIGATGSYTFYDVNANHTIQATFAPSGGGTTEVPTEAPPPPEAE